MSVPGKPLPQIQSYGGRKEKASEKGEGYRGYKYQRLSFLNAQRHRHGSSAKEVDNAKPGAIPYDQSTETRKEQQSKHHEEKLVPTLSFYDRTNPHKPSALPSLTASQPRQYTISIALPGSIILN